MKTKCLFCLCGLLAVASLSQAQTIAQWTFEGHTIATSTSSIYGYGPPEVGSGTGQLLSYHEGPVLAPLTVFSGPVGNGSAQSFGCNAWGVGVPWVIYFSPTTPGYRGIQLDWDQISSPDGPGIFKLQWSIDNGFNYTTFGSDYTVLADTAPNTWTSGTYNSSTHYTVDLSSITALNNAATMDFMLMDDSTTSAGGGIVSTAGTSRVDNFTISIAPVPEPTSVALLGLGAAGLLFWRQRNSPASCPP